MENARRKIASSLLSWPSRGDRLVIVSLPGEALTGVLEPAYSVVIFAEKVGFVPGVIVAMLANVRQQRLHLCR